MRLKQGQRVRIITDNPKHGWGYAKKGDIGFVRNHLDGNPVRVLFPEHRDKELWSGLPEELEILPHSSLDPCA